MPSNSFFFYKCDKNALYTQMLSSLTYSSNNKNTEKYKIYSRTNSES